ncbi:hypothetical protein PILCRDRAFT_818628, partial [Piloderma croceum F 1598]
MLATRKLARSSHLQLNRSVRWASTFEKDKCKVVVVEGGSGGLSVAHQILDRFRRAGKPLYQDDIDLGWYTKTAFRRPFDSLIPSDRITHISENVKLFSPASSSITTTSGRSLTYKALVLSAGLKIGRNAIPGLSKALADPTSGVSSIYSYDTCDKVWNDIEALRMDQPIFTQPAGIIKCPGAPQKITCMAWDRYMQTKHGEKIKIDFFTGMPTMFIVKKYTDALNNLRVDRGVGGHFQHNLVSINPANRKATFKKADQSTVDVDFTLLHVTPPMGPHDFLKSSPIVDAVGRVDIDKGTLKHAKPEFGNIFALSDCSSLPTSKTAAAITSQAPVLTENIFSVLETGKLLTVYDRQSILAEFKYGLEPKETFSWIFNQGKPK